MSWIDYYGLLVCFWLLLCLLMISTKKTRALGLSLSFSTSVLFIGLTILQDHYGANVSYQLNKKEKFLEAMKSEEVTLNLTPSSWIQEIDGRGSNSIIPLKYRKQIGIAFPLGAAPNVKTFYCSEDDGFISYVTDRFGFRNEDDRWNSSAHDILILGDSFAESACIPTALQTTFSENLNVVSLGKGGNGPLSSLATFIEYNNRFKARIVYFLVVSNDYSRPTSHSLAIDLERELLEPELSKYLDESDNIQDYFNEQYLEHYKTFAVEHSKLLANTSLESDFTHLLRAISRIAFYDFFKSIVISQGSGNVNKTLRFIDRVALEQVYSKAIQTADNSSSKLIFVPLPDKASACNHDVKKLFIDDLLGGLNANVLDIWGDLCYGKFFANSGGHFNQLGYKFLADRIEADFLEN